MRLPASSNSLIGGAVDAGVLLDDEDFFLRCRRSVDPLGSPGEQGFTIGFVLLVAGGVDTDSCCCVCDLLRDLEGDNGARGDTECFAGIERDAGDPNLADSEVVTTSFRSGFGCIPAGSSSDRIFKKLECNDAQKSMPEISSLCNFLAVRTFIISFLSSSSWLWSLTSSLFVVGSSAALVAIEVEEFSAFVLVLAFSNWRVLCFLMRCAAAVDRRKPLTVLPPMSLLAKYIILSAGSHCPNSCEVCTDVRS